MSKSLTLRSGSNHPWPQPTSHKLSQESAVAAFIALTVILTVTSYFLYQAYSSSEAKLQSANEEVNKKNRENSVALTQYDEVKVRVGTKATDHDQTKEEIATHFQEDRPAV